ncbi:sugar ABC transporter substrate-binding protein [Spirillospora sp. NPDC046719]
MKFHSRATTPVAALVLALTGASLTACSGSTASGSGACSRRVAVDQYKIPACGPLRLAVFLPGTNNADLQSRVTYLKSAIRKVPGASMTIFDAKFDTTTQVDQIQNALQSRKYNAAIAAPIDGRLTCAALSRQAPAAGVLVAVPNLALCGRTSEEAAALRAPGTLTYVGGTQSPQYWRDYLTWIARRLGKPTKFLALTDPAAPFPLTKNFQTALADVTRRYPDLDVVATADTDLTVAGAYQKARALIQAHPEATGLITMFSTETQGAFQALRAAGRSDRFQIYDKGATPWAVQALKAGDIAATSPERPVTSTARMLAALVDARAGKKVEPVYLNDGAATPAKAPASGFTVFTRDTLGDYEGQG